MDNIITDSPIEIYCGSSSFSPGQTAFGFYDSDSQFVSDADKVVRFCMFRLGYPIMNVELQSGSIYLAFEEAVTVYGNEVYQWQIRENLGGLIGSSLPSDVSSLSEAIVSPNLGSVIRLAKNYGSEAGSGGTVNWYSGSLMLTPGVQTYDLNQWAAASASLEAGDSIEIKRVFYEGPPAIARYFDPFAGTGLGAMGLMEQFGFGGDSPGITFLMMPLSFDVLRIQAIEFNDMIRRSGFSFEVHNNDLRIFPIPSFPHHLQFQYIKVSERDNSGIISTTVSGSSVEKISNVLNAPYSNPTYSKINSVGRQWIYQYTLAIVKEMLGLVRSKYSTVPIPGSEISLNGAELLAGSTTDKTALLENLRGMLEQSSRNAYLTRQSQENEFIQKTLSASPLPIYIF